MYIKIIKLLFSLLIFSFIACQKTEGPTVVPEDKPKENSDEELQMQNMRNRISGASVGTFTNELPYALNIVYFIPSDMEPANNFQKRLSELMLWTQAWYKTQMNANGYPNTTFGLFTDAAKKNVRFNIIFGKKDKSNYDYDNGSGNVIAEMNEFYAANPSLKTGEHNLIILPSFFYNANKTPGGGNIGPPFYGLGKNCFALDYHDMDLKYLGKNGTDLEKAFIGWFGGLVHELGHGLNLPHNRQKVSEGNDPNKGMSLMWAGNSTLGFSPTFLTPADAAVLSNNQVFAKSHGSYYGSVSASFKSVKAKYDTNKKSIVISGKYESSIPVKNVLCFNDPNVNNEGSGVNKDYNAIAWEVKPIGQDSFYFDMPIDELVEKSDNMEYELKLKLVHSNGNVTQKIYSYKFFNGIPDIDFGNNTLLSKTDWTIHSFSSEEINTTYPGQATRLIDGNLNTYWHSNWSVSPGSSHPHNIVVDIKKIQNVSGAVIHQRHDGSNGRSKDIEIHISTDGVSFTKVSNYTLMDNQSEQLLKFNDIKSLRYIKLIVNSSYGASTEKNCSIAELDLY